MLRIEAKRQRCRDLMRRHPIPQGWELDRSYIAGTEFENDGGLMSDGLGVVYSDRRRRLQEMQYSGALLGDEYNISEGAVAEALERHGPIEGAHAMPRDNMTDEDRRKK